MSRSVSLIRVRRAEYMPAPGAVAAARAAEAALLHAARVGTAEDVRACASRVAGSSLADIDAPGSHGVTPLHAAASRGDPDVARALLDAGAAACHSHARPLRADAESGWTATHRAMYHGKWRVVQALLERGGSLDHPADLAGRTPLDVLAARLRRSREGPLARADPRESSSSGRPESDDTTARRGSQRLLYTWGSGVNYQLGHGSRDDVATPRRVDCLAGVGGGVVSFDASKFHSVVALRDGSVMSWGHGRGGRLGVDDAKVHDGDVAALTPTPVPFPVSARIRKHFVVRVAAGKHHTLAVTRRGAVFSWGSGADGRLGYDARDADASSFRAENASSPFGSLIETTTRRRDDAYQRTPRLVAGALRDAFAVDVAAANRHSVVATRAGDVFAFGSNAFGQLGTRERARAPARATRATRQPANAELCFSQNLSSSERERGVSSFGSFGSPSSHGSPASSPKLAFVGEAFLRSRSEAAPASASNGTGPERTNEPCEWSPKEADALKPLSRVFVAVSASKQHTLVLDATGAVYQFGQGDHSPRRVALRDSETVSKKRVECVADGKKERSKNASSFFALPEAGATEVAAGANVSLARARDGSVWCWFSRDPHLRSFRVAGFGTANDTEAISVAARESRCAVVTAVGDAYLCDAPEFSFDASDTQGCSRNGLRAPALPFRRAEGVRRVDAVRLGETHALATQALSGSSGSGTVSESARELVRSDSDSSAGSSGESDDASDDVNDAYDDRIDTDDDDDDDVSSSSSSSSSSETFSLGVFKRLERLDCFAGDEKNELRTNRRVEKNKTKARKKRGFRVPSLRMLAQTSLARSSCDARSVFELLAFAESVGAEALAARCRSFATRNADAIFAERGGDALVGVPAETLRVLETWSARLDAETRLARDEADAAFLAETEGLVSSANPSETFTSRRFSSDRRSGDSRNENPENPETKTKAGNEDAALPSRDDDANVVSSSANVPCTYPTSWLEARTARGVAKTRRPAEPPTLRSRILAGGPAGSSSRSRRAAADAAASRIARGGLSLFLSGALEDAVARGGGDAAVAAAAAARDARRRAPPRSWGAVDPAIPRDPGAAGSPGIPGTAASPSLLEIAAAQEREAREAAARARGYAATAARKIETANASGPVYAPVSAAARGVASPAAGPTAVSLAALASRSRGAYGGRGEASRKGNPKLLASAWSLGGETVLTHQHASASGAATSGPSPARTETPGAFVSLSEILREEEAAAAERASSSETRAGGHAGSLGDGGSLGKSGWFVPDARGGSPGRAAGGLAGIVRDEEATRAAAEAARRLAPERRKPGGRPKERPKERPKDIDTRKSSRRGKKETSANDDAARSKGARAPRRGTTDANDSKKRLSRTTLPSTDASDRTTDSRGTKAPTRKASRETPRDIGGDVREASARGSSRESDVCSFSHAARAVDEKKKKTASSAAPATSAGGRRSRRPRPKPTEGY